LAKTTKRRATPRHTWEVEVDYHDGNGPQMLKQQAKVVLGRKHVDLKLSTKDIEESLALDGVGNSMMCAMSQSCKRQRNQFPHPTLGPIDWLYKTCFVATKRNAQGQITECVKYEHRDDIAKLFDTTAGLKKLLRRAYDNGGYIEIHLIPARDRRGESSRGGNVERSGKRSTPTQFSRGSKHRYAIATAGRGLSLKLAKQHEAA
jgi:hypothetical protein